MATSGNRRWVFVEAKRRAASMDRDYVIYRHRANTDDHIIRPVAHEAPPTNRWERLATITPRDQASWLD